MKKQLLFVLAAALLTPLFVYAEDKCFPELEGKKGTQVLETLYSLIKDHTVLSYDDVRADRAGVDINKVKNTVRDIYSSCEFGVDDYCGNESGSGECDCYNREHILPQSWWDNDNKQPMRSDLHHVVPTDVFANSQRASWPYGEVTGTPTWSNSLGSKLGYSSTYDSKVFEPADQYKGDIARIYFYMITCYYDKNFAQSASGKKVFTYSNGKAGFTSTAINMLLKWHRNDPVSAKERTRNNAVEPIQGNRNPFVDAPDLAEYIWGNKKTVAYQCGTGIGHIETQTPRATKRIENGMLILVMPDGTRYNTQGIQIR